MFTKVLLLIPFLFKFCTVEQGASGIKFETHSLYYRYIIVFDQTYKTPPLRARFNNKLFEAPERGNKK